MGMNVTEALSRFALGGGLIVLVSLIGKSKNPSLSGLAVLFPIVTVVGFYFLSRTVAPLELKSIILFSIFSLPSVLAFLLALYWAVGKFPILASMFVGIGAWLATALLILWLKGVWDGLH